MRAVGLTSIEDSLYSFFIEQPHRSDVDDSARYVESLVAVLYRSDRIIIE